MQTLAMLGHGAEKWPEADQHRLINELAYAYWGMGENKLAADQWLKIAHQQKSDVASRLMLFDLAMRTDDETEMARLVKELKDIEDPEGTLWRYCEACRLTWRSQKKRMKRPSRRRVRYLRWSRPAAVVGPASPWPKPKWTSN